MKNFKTFKEWVVLKEGRKKKKNSPEVNAFIQGKTDKLTLPDKPAAIGHQSHISGAGAHDNRPKRQRTRSAQKQSWKKDQGY